LQHHRAEKNEEEAVWPSGTYPLPSPAHPQARNIVRPAGIRQPIFCPWGWWSRVRIGFFDFFLVHCTAILVRTVTQKHIALRLIVTTFVVSTASRFAHTLRQRSIHRDTGARSPFLIRKKCDSIYGSQQNHGTRTVSHVFTYITYVRDISGQDQVLARWPPYSVYESVVGKL